MKKEFIIGIVGLIFLSLLVSLGFYLSNKNSGVEIITNPLTNLTGDTVQNYITNMIFFHNQALNLSSWYMKNGQSEKIRSLASSTYSLKDQEIEILSGFARKYGAMSPEYKNIIFPEKSIDDFYIQNIKSNHETEINLSRKVNNNFPQEIQIFAKKVDIALSSQLQKFEEKN